VLPAEDAGAGPDDATGSGIDHRDRVELQHRQEEVAPGERWIALGQPAVQHLERVRVEDVAATARPGAAVAPDAAVLRLLEGLEQRETTLFFTARVEKRDEVLEYRLLRVVPGDDVGLPRQDVDPAVR